MLGCLAGQAGLAPGSPGDRAGSGPGRADLGCGREVGTQMSSFSEEAYHVEADAEGPLTGEGRRRDGSAE